MFLFFLGACSLSFADSVVKYSKRKGPIIHAYVRGAQYIDAFEEPGQDDDIEQLILEVVEEEQSPRMPRTQANTPRSSRDGAASPERTHAIQRRFLGRNLADEFDALAREAGLGPEED